MPVAELPGPVSSLDLTPAQWQVARLIAVGATNREGTARLVLSHRPSSTTCGTSSPASGWAPASS